MKALFFVHTYNERNGISLHVRNLIANMPKDAECAVISGGAFSLPFFSSLRFPIKEIFKALGTDFDVMHIHGYGNFFSFFGAIIAAAKRKPLVWTIHGYPQIKGFRRLFYYVYRYLMAPFIFWKAGRIISVSSDARQAISKETRKIAVLLPNGVDLELFKPTEGYAKQNFACYVGRLDEDKGVMRMLECTAHPVLFVGPDEDGMRQKLRDAAAARKLDVKFAEVAPEKMPHAYEKCRYVVLPSKYEGLPLTLLEAVAMERPFVCTDVGEVKKIMATLFDRPEEFLLSGNVGEKIAELDKKGLSEEMKKARKRAEAYSWKGISEKTAQIYREMMSRHAKQDYPSSAAAQ